MVTRRNALFSFLTVPVVGQTNIVKSVDGVDYVEQTIDTEVLNFTKITENFVKRFEFNQNLVKRNSIGYYDATFMLAPYYDKKTKIKFYKSFPYLVYCKDVIYNGQFYLNTSISNEDPRWAAHFLTKHEPVDFSIYLPDTVCRELAGNLLLFMVF